jgi:hypothetical protein
MTAAMPQAATRWDMARSPAPRADPAQEHCAETAPRSSTWETADEADHRLAEPVVGVPGDHVTGARDIHNLGVRHKTAQFRHAFLAHHVTAVPADQQGWDDDIAGRRGEPGVFM